MQSEIDAIGELQVRRKFYIKAVNREKNAAGALVRRAMGWTMNDDEADREKVRTKASAIVAKALSGKGCEIDALKVDFDVIARSIEPKETMRHECELAMERIVRKLPIWEWAESVRGLGQLGVGVIIGEVGNLSSYSGPCKMRKRLGMAPYQKDGETMAGATWKAMGGLDADDWTAYGYSPHRRAEMYAVIGDPLFRGQWSKEKGPIGPYGEYYKAYKDRQNAKNEAGDYRETALKIAKKHGKKASKINLEGKLMPMHIHKRALRYMTQCLLRDMWCAWNGKSKPNETQFAEAA